jgi:tetratricopeptide (TPR) repeat protein
MIKIAFKVMPAAFMAAALLASAGRLPAQTNASAAVTNDEAAAPATLDQSQEALRSYLEIQEQLHNTQLALEHNRQEAEAASQRNAELLQATLSLVEKSLNNQRVDELKDMQRSNRLMLIAAGAFAAVGFVVLIFTGFLQWSAVRRLSVLTAALPSAGHSPAELADASFAAGSLKDSTTRFIGTIDRLEKRIYEMELALKGKKALPEAALPNGDDEEEGDALSGEHSSTGPSETETSALLINKGETLLKLDQAEAALACFEEALVLDAANPHALLRKGVALERLQRWDEALACYDRAIAVDSFMTMAYLYKGGIFNRMGRYSEALECYERALKSQERGHPATTVVE